MPWTKEQKAAYMREWRRKNPEKQRAIDKRRYENHKDRINSRDRAEETHARHLRNMADPAYRSKRVEYTRRWQSANPEKIADRRSERWRTDPEYRAQRYATAFSRRWQLTKADRRILQQMYLEDCFYCGNLGGSVDHLVPKSRGGEDSWSNLVPCCRSCNSKKSDSTPEEFYLRRPMSKEVFSVGSYSVDLEPEHSGGSVGAA